MALHPFFPNLYRMIALDKGLFGRSNITKKFEQAFAMENARTLMIATLGPASNDKAVMKSLVEAGVDIFRVNLSHADRELHRRTIRDAKESGVKVMIDLPGPKIRISGSNSPLPMDLKCGASVLLAASGADFHPSIPSLSLSVPVDFSRAREGMRILIDDGKLELVVKDVSTRGLTAEMLSDGAILPRKGVAFSEDLTDLPPLVDDDRTALRELAGEPFDMVAASFVRNARCIMELRKELEKHGCGADIIAKIEDPSGVANMDEIAKCSDGIMVARGDLGVCTPIAALPILQKRMVAVGVYYRKFVVVATQMLESMTESPFPTRAEVTDVANAVFDGADAVMLSGETAVGKYPLRTVETMARIIGHAEDAMKTGLKAVL